MGGAAFDLLKTGRSGPESAKQAEIRLADLLKILRIAWSQAPSRPAMAQEDTLRLYWRRFRPDMANSGRIAWFCYPDHSFCSGTGAVFYIGMQVEYPKSISADFYTSNYARVADF